MHTLSNNRAGAASSIGEAPVGDSQLELAFAANSPCPLVGQRPGRPGRAAWWFQRMRQIVDRACDWEPTLPARPDQIWLPHACREVSLAPQFSPGQHQVCE
jgi:hypothetical protein